MSGFMSLPKSKSIYRSLQHSHLHWNLSSINNNPGRGIRSGVRSPCTLARRRYGLVKIQAKLCRSTMEAMPHVQNAAMLASETCRNVFKHRRWNCSSIVTAPYLTPDLTRATREQAYVYAISSAALTFTMARACSSGSLYHCTCASKPSSPTNGQFQWGGCGDNIKWGTQFAKRFIDNVEKYTLEKSGTKAKRHSGNGKTEEGEKMVTNEVAAVNLHNNRVGRKVMAESLQTQCKCHGVSGSCNIKTCWKALPPMLVIGQKILQKYTNAIEIPKASLEKGLPESGSKKNKNKSLKSQQLIYLSKSPDYCTKDEKLGSFGTVGRQCNVTSNGLESCRQLCCGRGYRTVVDEKIERCQCKIYGCCYVKCKICRMMTQVYECL
ncbi:protein Wnt-11b-2-like [Anoplophora glabripennis]|uniref:protein Wnt-11b-2-like n=1 Tax=Anoplophora glabripennis TaxID=217634 RepID=UPI0008739966|nr:protein Wnt-11b-2-like [Anoplophora glabripennis]